MINAKGNISEHTTIIEDGGGYRLEERRVQVDQIGLKWGTYISAEERQLAFLPEETTVVSHFRLTDEPAEMNRRPALGTRHFVVYREPAAAYELAISATPEGPRSFFELALSESFFDDLVTTDSAFLTRFQTHASTETPYYDFIAAMSPAMYSIIAQMQQAPYTGSLKGLYLEAKAIELFLLQVQELDRERPGVNLSAGDIERLHFIRETMTKRFGHPWSIALLAREAGLNQMKLKTGFKALFGTTLFGYLADIRMEEARRLLQEEKLSVGEVADRIGYQHPHHFTTAFGRRFGVLPSKLRQ